MIKASVIIIIIIIIITEALINTALERLYRLPDVAAEKTVM